MSTFRICLSKNLRRIRPVLLILVILGSLYTPTPAHAQAGAARFTHLTSEQGLAHDMVRCILQDSRGFMWFGTDGGLSKYDGYTFTTYRHRRSDPGSLSENTIYALYEDAAGTLWVGTPVGLDSFAGEGSQFTHYPAIGEEVSAIYEDSSGALWIGTASAGLYKYERATGQFTQYLPDPADPHSLSDDEVSAIYEDSSGNLWVGTTHGGLNALDRATRRFTHYRHDPADRQSLSHDRVTAIYEDDAGVLWVGAGDDYEITVGGLNAFKRGVFTHYFHDPQNPGSLSNNHVKSIYQDRDGTLWIGTDDGLDALNRATHTFAGYRHDPLDPYSLSDSRITAIYEDRSGILWIGTDGRGVNKYAWARERFKRFQNDPLDPNSLSPGAVGAIWEDAAGVLWIGIPGKGLDSLDRSAGAASGGTFVHYTHGPDDPQSLGHNNVRALCQDHEGVLWIGTGQGLDRFVPGDAGGAFSHYSHDPDDPGSLGPGVPGSLGPGEVKAILEDHTHALWVATEDPGTLNRLDRATGAFVRYAYEPDHPDSFVNTGGIRTLYEDVDGDLWLGTYNGLVHFDRATEEKATFTQYRANPEDPHSISHNFVWTIYQDQAGNLWVGTSGGLNRLDPATGGFQVYTVEDGLPSDQVRCIRADRQGNLWLGTDSGLSRFDPRAETFKNYDVGDGLTNNVLILGACHRSQSGEMFFGTDDGFMAFYPDDIRDDVYIPPVVLTAFRKFDRVVEFNTPLSEVKEITLSYADDFFAFEFAALDYVEPAKNQYAYKLEGFDQDWVYCGTRRYAGYTNLPPGAYTFRVKGTNSDGVWNEAGQMVNVTITPPFWETWWFMVVAGAFALGVIFLMARARMRNVAILRESEARFRALFENAPLCVFEVDMAQTPPRIVRANRRSERMYGWPAVEFASAPLDRIFSEHTWPTLARMMRALGAGETLTMESTSLRRDGAEFPIHISATGEPGHDLRQVILAIEDVTAEKERRSEEEAIVEERHRIAREIHDGLAQDLAGLRFKVGMWHKLVDGDASQMHAELDGLRELLGRNIREVRRSIFALRPVALDELGFYPALRQFIDEFGEQNQLHVTLHVEGEAEELPAFLELVLFRILQESLHNAGKHAQAQMVWIELDLESPRAITLNVRDDGVGFDPATLETMVQHGHLGLKQMRERVEKLGGAFELHSQPGSGTTIRVVLPRET
ncbi:MAG: PAS domain S-box protein [Anaerolineae bacterium]|nr:PAS domain S-box protein [Anaerolineae bacterium]